jgi:hypothetical protein
MLSPILVGGVDEDDCAFEDVSTVIALLIESEEDARVISTRAGGRDDDSILSIRTENIVMS